MLPLPLGAVRQTLILVFLLFFIEETRADKKVVCYYTNWSVYRPGTAKFNPQNINPYLCTHLIYAFGGFTKDNTLKAFDKYQDIEQGGYAKFTGLKTYNKNLKTLLAIGGWNEGSSRFSPLVANPERRHQFIKNILKFLRQNHFDGLDLDWEYPAHRDGGKSRDKENYALFVQELRAEFDRESSKTGRPRLLLTMAVPAGIEYIEKGYDIPKLNKYLDWFNILSYDYHSAYEPSVNHHAPLYPLQDEDDEYNFDGELNIDYTIKHYLKAGADRDKLVLGIPTYGRSYTLINEDSTDIGAPSDGPGEQGDATREKGYLAYYEICQNIKTEDDWTVVQPNPKSMGPYAFKKNQWVGYDDEDIVKKKAEYVVSKGLGGIMFWSIDNDDFRGNCNGRPYPLIEAAKEAMFDRYNDNEVIKQDKVRKPGRSRSQSNSSTRNQAFNNEDKKKTQSRIKQTESRKRISSTTTTSTTTTPIPVTRTTPAPPTTPDPGADFKCEDEGFFPHPRDCKKYYWCLDSGPSNLGLIAHQFTCPSGLYFNPAADSCDFTRNVLCKKNIKQTTTKATTVTTTKATTTTLTTPSKAIKLKTTSTTPEPEYENYEDDDQDEDPQTDEEKGTTKDPEEDPKVIKELIDLIKKVGGIKELEKLLQQDDQDNTTGAKNQKNSEKSRLQETFTGKSLYSKVLGRQNSLTSLKDRFSTLQAIQRNSKSSDITEDYKDDSSSEKYSSVVRNSRPRPQNDGINKLAEFDGFLREKPKYVTLNRSRPAATKSDESKSVDNKKVEEEDNDEDEDNEDEDDNEDDNERGGFRSRVTSEKPQLSSTLSYINIRRTLPSTTTAVPSLELTVATTEFSKVDETKTKVPPSFLRNRYKTLVRSNTQNVTNQNEYEEEEPPNVTVINTENNENTQAPKRKFVTYNATERRTTIPATQTVQAEDQQESTTKSYIKQTNTNNIFSLINTHNIRTTQSTSPTTIQQPLIETSSYSSIPTKDPLFSTISTISNETNLDLTEVPLDFESIDKKLDETTVSNTDKTNESDLLNLDNEINFNKENDTININEKIFNSTQSNCSNIEVLKEGSHSDINFIHCNDGESSYTKTSTKSTPLDETTTPFLGTISSPRPFTPIHKRIRIRPVIKNSLNKTSSLENSNSSSVESETNNKNNDVTINKNYSKGINNTDAQAKGDYESTTKQINGRRIRVLKFKRPVTNTVEDKSILKSNSTKTEFSEKNEQLDSTTKIPLRKKVFIRKRPLTTTIASTASGVELNEGNATEIESKESEFKHSDRRIKYIKKIILKNDTSTEKKGTEVDGNENLTIDLKNVDNKFDEEVADRITNLTDKEAVTNFREKIYLNRRPIRPTKLPGTSSTTKDLDDSVSENVNDSLNLTNLDRGKSKFRVGFSNIRNGNFTEKSVVSENEIKKANDLNYKTIVRTNYLNRKVEQASIGDYNKTIINVNENESENNEQKSDDDEDDDYDDEDDDDENDDENDYNDENYDNNEEKLEKDKEKPLNENFNKIGLINNFDSNSFNNRIRTNLQNYTNRRQNVPVGINRNITTKKSNRFRINRPNNIPKISNRNFPTTTPHPISNQISVTTTFPLTTPSIFKSTNTKLRKYTTVTSTTESTLKDDLLLDLNVNALNARNKKIFEITSKKHTTVKPKPKEQISILDNENNISNVNETQTTDISELSEKNVKSYSNNDLNNFQETALENSIQGSSPITEQPPVTTTQKATTFSHIFSVGNINGISTTEMSEIEKDISTTIENEEKLVEINRVVEVSSKENKLKLKSIGVDLDNIKTSDIKLVEPPHIDKLGEISRVKYVTLVESGEDYSTTKSYDELHNENIKYNDNILNESEKRGRQLILPEVIRGIETSTIPLEGLFKTYRKSKANEIHYNSPVYALSLGEAYITSKPITNDDDISYEPVYKGESKDEKIQEDIKTTTSSFLFDTTTVQQDRTTNYIRPIVPLLRPESNESSPLVISIANLDKSQLTLRQNSRPLLNLRNRSTTQLPSHSGVTSIATTLLNRRNKFDYRTTEKSQTTISADENSTPSIASKLTISRRKYSRPSNYTEGKKSYRTTTTTTTTTASTIKDNETSTNRLRNMLFKRKYYTTTIATTTPISPSSTKLIEKNRLLPKKDNDQEVDSSIQDKKFLDKKTNYFDNVDEKNKDEILVEAIKAISQAPIPVSITSASTLKSNFSSSDAIENGDTLKISTHLPDRSSTSHNISHKQKIRTTIKTTTQQPSSTTEIIRQKRPTKIRQPFDRVTSKQKFSPENVYRPITDYDYYDDDDVKVIAKSNSQVKVILHGRGLIECLDQGNFPHPLSCRKFISCAKMETGGVVGWEYTCPKNLSYDPVGGICNWAAGLGCKD